MDTMDHAHPRSPRADDPPTANLLDSDEMEGGEELHEQDIAGERENNNLNNDRVDEEHGTTTAHPSPHQANAAPAQPAVTTTTSTRRASLRRHVKTSRYTNDDEDNEEENDNQDEDHSVQATVPVPTSTSSPSFTPATTTTTITPTPTTTNKRSKTKSVNGLLPPRPRKSTAGAPRIHQCVHCVKSFARRSDLQRHIRTHLGDKPFVCPDCQKRFIQVSALRVHQRIHSGEKPYKCPDCEKCFADSSSLVRHRRVHSGERPYKCTLSGCERSFCRNVTLLKHQLREHGLESCKEDGKPYLSLLPSSQRPRRIRRPKAVVDNNNKTSMESTSAPAGVSTGTMNNATAAAENSGTTTAAAVASSSSSHAPIRSTRKAKSELSSLEHTDSDDLEGNDENYDDQFGAHQAEEQVKTMNEALDISNATSRRASTNSFTSQRSIMNPSLSNDDHQGLQGDYGYTSKTTYGLTTVYAAKQRLGSLQLGNYHYMHPNTASNNSSSSNNNVPMLSIPPNPLTSTGFRIKNGLSQANGLNGGRKTIDIHAATSINNSGILNGPLTPDTPNSARSCFSAPEISQHINVGTPLEVGASPFSDAGYNLHSHPSSMSSRNSMNGQSRMNEVYTGASQDGHSDSNGMMGVEETYPLYHHRNAQLHGGQIFIHTNMQGIESSSSHDAGPYSARYAHSSHHQNQDQDFHHPSSSTAPATQTMFIDRYHHPTYNHHPAAHQQQQPSGPLHQQGQYDHLPAPASAASYFSNSSGTGADKQSTAPSSVPATSPYAHSFPQALSHTSQPHQGGSNGSAYMHCSPHGHHNSSHHYGYGNTYAQQYVPEPPLSATIPPTPGFHGDHHQIHYRTHAAASGEWALPHAGSMDQKDGLGHASPYYHAHHPHQYRRPNEQHQQQQQSQHHYIPHPTTRSNSFHVRDVIGEEEHRKSSLPSAVGGDILNTIDDNENGRSAGDHSPSFENMFKLENKSITSPLLVAGGDESM